MRTRPPLLAPIFRSDGQARLLSALLLAGDELSLTDVAERADLAYPTAHREVARLLDAGILVERQVGRTRLIRGNPDSPLTAPLREILTVLSGPVVLLAEEFERIDGIQSAFLYGSFAARLRGVDGPAPHDIDVMVVGAPDVDAIYEACTRVESAVHRPVNATILSSSEFKAESGFLDTVRASPIAPVMGEWSWRNGIAYDAAHDIGEALLAAYGSRTANGPGQHEALGRYLRAVLDKPPADKAANAFDRLRRAPNQDRYEAKPVGAAAAKKAEQVARELFEAAVARGMTP